MRILTIVVFATLQMAMTLPADTQAGDLPGLKDQDIRRVKGRVFQNGTAYTGPIAIYYTDGTMKSLQNYANGLREGTARSWWPDGILQALRNYRQDLLEGETMEWYPSGQLRYRQQYSGGREHGLQESWHEDGLPAFAYAYIDGRRYGVLGSKPCFTSNIAAETLFNESP